MTAPITEGLGMGGDSERVLVRNNSVVYSGGNIVTLAPGQDPSDCACCGCQQSSTSCVNCDTGTTPLYLTAVFSGVTVFTDCLSPEPGVVVDQKSTRIAGDINQGYRTQHTPASCRWYKSEFGGTTSYALNFFNSNDETCVDIQAGTLIDYPSATLDKISPTEWEVGLAMNTGASPGDNLFYALVTVASGECQDTFVAANSYTLADVGTLSPGGQLIIGYGGSVTVVCA